LLKGLSGGFIDEHFGGQSLDLLRIGRFGQSFFLKFFTGDAIPTLLAIEIDIALFPDSFKKIVNNCLMMGKCPLSVLYEDSALQRLFHQVHAFGLKSFGRLLALSSSHRILQLFWNWIEADPWEPLYNSCTHFSLLKEISSSNFTQKLQQTLPVEPTFRFPK